MKRLLTIVLILLVNWVYAQKEEILVLRKNILPKDRICFALYTVHENTLKLTAQFYPIKDHEPFRSRLQIKKAGKWVDVCKSDILYPGYTSHFRVENWDDTQEVSYRVVHNNKAFYEGIIRENPIEEEKMVMAAFTCNSIYPRHGGNIPKQDIVDNVKKLKPDLLFFSGDQVYDHSEHYLYWLKFGEDFGDIIRNYPTICIVDDHDVGQANLWGANGKKATARNGVSGGYYMPAEYVNEVQRVQTWHLPDAYDPTPVEQGITVYYTDLKWGGMSFAILEDRKFKSGLEGIFNHSGKQLDAVLDPDFDTRKLNNPKAELLGDRQLEFLDDWSTDWENAEMKSVLSQTIFAQGANYSGKHGQEVYGDPDSNGWPQGGRNIALETIRKSYSCMIGGDQHLGTVIKHGIREWGDAGYSFCTPAIANYWVRWWEPTVKGQNTPKNGPAYTGDYHDGFHNKITMVAAANPTEQEKKVGGKLSTRAAGYGVVTYNKKDRTIIFDCWGRNVDITDPASKQYKGWPVTIAQTDNFVVKNGFELPTFKISEANQVVTVRDYFTSELVLSIRVKGQEFMPKVIESSKYTITVGEGDKAQHFIEIPATKKNKTTITVTL